jgi:hypothetical protein
LTINCLEYEGAFYRAYLDRFENPFDRQQRYFKLVSYSLISAQTPCAVLGKDFALRLPDIEGKSGMVLSPWGNPADPGGYYWRIVFP